MSDLSKLSRRTLLGGLAATASVAAIGQFANLPDALARTTTPARGDAPVLPVEDVRGGFRATFLSRLSALERVAGLAPIPAEDPFRPWALASLRRVEEFYGVIAEPPGDQSWRLWVLDRLTVVERNLPAALRFPFYTHMPLDTPSGEYGPFLRQRIEDGSCNGVFLYMDARTPLAPTAFLESITSSGPPVPILISPKNVSDPVKLAAFMDYWVARPAWIPYVRVAYWQEPQGDFGGAGQPPLSVWQDNVLTLADAADRVGIASVAHVETWHLHPIYQPDGGIPRLLDLLQPVAHRLGGGISWSVFVFNQKPRAANDYVAWMNEFMAEYFPYLSYGTSAYGDAIHPDIPPDDPMRVERAARIASMYTDLGDSRARYGGYYALPVGPDPSAASGTVGSRTRPRRRCTTSVATSA